ncbi:MAG TPA: hypothetical protein VK638_10725 [Edaphobacter sp.]|nr:hypothetical protein [Edaphobacter sp.]
MPTQWITDAAQKCKRELAEQRNADYARQREEEVERQRLQRIVVEGPDAGAQLWSDLQAVIKYEIVEFNEEFGETVLRPKALGDGTFEVHFGEPGGTETIAALTYATETTTLSWHIFGGPKGVPLTVGLRKQPPSQGQPELQFTDGQAFYGVPEISKRIISNLLP